jgi:RHS repeat-associated protein
MVRQKISAMRTHLRFLHFTILLLSAVAAAAQVAERAFTLGGTAITLQDASGGVDIFYRSMRFNRALNAWNVEVLITNRGTQPLSGPFIYLIEGATNTSGVIAADGVDGANAFLDLSAFVPDGILSPGESSVPRTLTFGVTSGSPRVTARIFSLAPSPVVSAVASTRTLDETGQPLTSVGVIETSPGGQRVYQSDPHFGVITLAQTAGDHVWQFNRSNFLPVWRRLFVPSNEVSVVPSPRLTRRSTNMFALTPIAGGQLADAAQKVQISFSPGSFAQPASGTLTLLTGQTLPAFLPLGWSPLQAFWTELSHEPVQAGTALLIPLGPIAPTETAALVRWNPTTLQWDVLQLTNGNGTNGISVSLAGSGAYVLVVPDTGTTAPPPAQVGQPLQPATAALPDPGQLTAGGRVYPTSSPASRVPELVTAKAEVTVTNASGPLPSGLLLHCDVGENYLLQDGSRRVTPQYAMPVSGYQRPGDNQSATLTATFPLRPLLLLGSDELVEATLNVNVLAPPGFSGATIETNGGQITAGGLSVLAGDGDLSRRQAAMLRKLDTTNFLGVATASNAIVQAFELSVADVSNGRHLVPRFGLQTSNSLFVLARSLFRDGLFGLEPVERFASDEAGRLNSLEPASGERFSGITGAGQYLLLRVETPQALVSGTAHNTSGQATGGLAMRSGPWLTFSETNGAYRLLSPTGIVEVAVTDLNTGDSGQSTATVSDPQIPVNVNPSLATTGPHVIAVSPAPQATAVTRVAPIVVTFSEPINPGSLGLDGVQLLDAGNQLVSSRLSLNLQNTVATLLPVDPLVAGALHTIRVSSNITDRTGLPLERTSVFTFTTATELARPPGAQVISYEPTNGVALMEGTQGIADPESPVILVNETSGKTATVLSKPDGSFSNFIDASVDDFLSAVFVNQNGTRTVIPVSRQIFADGSVGLFESGGTVEAMGEHGPISLTIPPGAIPRKTVIKLTTVFEADALARVTNQPPEAGQVLGGFDLQLRGDPLRAEPQFRIPIETDRIALPPGESLGNGTFMIVAPHQADGTTIYLALESIDFENVTLASPPAVSAGRRKIIGVLVAILQGSLLALGNAGSAADIATQFNGLILYRFNAATFSVNGTVTAREFAADGRELSTVVLPGTFVGVRPLSFLSGRPGHLQPSAFYAVSGSDGRYRIHVGLPTTQGEYVVTGTHPRFPQRRVAAPLVRQLIQGAHSADLVFDYVSDVGNPDDKVPPGIIASHTPIRPEPGSNALVSVLVTDNSSRPTAQPPRVQSIQSLVPGVPVDAAGVAITNISDDEVGALGRRMRYLVQYTNAARIELLFEAVDGQANIGQSAHVIVFGGQSPSADNPLPSDPNDDVGPMVVFSWPGDGAAGLEPGAPVTLRFDTSLDRAAPLDLSWLAITPSAPPPKVELSEDGRELTLRFPYLLPDTSYTLTINSLLKDVSGNSFDQEPAVADFQDFSLRFRTAANPRNPIASIIRGGGAVIHGNYAYVLERAGTSQGADGLYNGGLLVYDIRAPHDLRIVARIPFSGYPRDLVLIPRYSFQLGAHGVTQIPTHPQTNDLLAIVGGWGGGMGGQYLRIVNISNPEDPLTFGVIASAQLTQASDAVVSRLGWDPPYLTYLSSFPDVDAVNYLHLQKFMYGLTLSREDFEQLEIDEQPGLDANGDGDYVDPGDRLPLPGKGGSLGLVGLDASFSVPDTTQGIVDYDTFDGGAYLGVVLNTGYFRDANGLPLTNEMRHPPAYRTLYRGNVTLDATNATVKFASEVKRLLALPRVAITVSNQPVVADLALVSLAPDMNGISHLVVLDITDPLAPREIGDVPLRFEFGIAQSAIVREDGRIALATGLGFTNYVTGSGILLLDPFKLTAPPSSDPTDMGHPAILGFIPQAGTGARHFTSPLSGLQIVSEMGINQLVLAPPAFAFVSLTNAPFLPADLVALGDGEVEARLANAQYETALRPARFQPRRGVQSSLSPPQAAVHYYVLVDAPGGAADAMGTIDLALESLNRSGHPIGPKGALFPPVRAISPLARNALQNGASILCELPTRTLKAWRLSNNKASPLYHKFLSLPFALTYESIDANQLAQLQAELDRVILWSGDFLRVSIDPVMELNSFLGPFSARLDLDRRIIQPGAGAFVPTLAGEYILGPNPASTVGSMSVPESLGSINAHNGELSIETTDLALPGRRLPLQVERKLNGQDLYEGPFGRGWDYNFNARLQELSGDVFPVGNRMPLVLRGAAAESEIAQSGDIIWHNGMGRSVLYTNAGETAPADVASDPLFLQQGWLSKAERYYLPARGAKGVFNFLVKFKDRKFASLESDGTQYWFGADGKLERIYDRYTDNAHTLVYNRRRELITILDELDRPVEIGYWRWASDPIFRSGADEGTTKPYLVGKICRITDYSNRDVLYFYTDDGLLERREGPNVTAAGPTGFTGRQITRYLNQSCATVDNANSRVAGVTLGSDGSTPLLAVSSFSAPGVVGGFSIPNGDVQFSLPQPNTSELSSSSSAATAADGSISEYHFDGLGLPSMLKERGPGAPEITTQFEFNQHGLVKKVTHPEGNVVEYTYDENHANIRSRGNLLAVKKTPGPRGGQEISFNHHYDDFYNLQQGVQTDANGFTIDITLHSDRRDIHKITYQNNDEEIFEFYDNGQPKRHKTPEGVEFNFTYDTATGFVETSSRGGLTTTYSYPGLAGVRGHATTITDPEGVATVYVYDERDNLVSETRAGRTETHSYDHDGRRIRTAETVEPGKEMVRRWEYTRTDLLDRLVHESVEVGDVRENLETKFDWTPLGRLTKATYPDGAFIEFHDYDHLGRPRRITQGTFAEEYAYDAHGNVVSVTRGDAVQWLFYDGHDRLTNTLSPEMETESFSYHGGDQLRSRTVTDPIRGIIAESVIDIDPLGRPDLITFTSDAGVDFLDYEYDSATRKLTVTDSRGEVLERVHDAAGRLFSEKDPTREQTFGYDDNDNLEQIISIEAGRTFTSTFSYNELNHRTREGDDVGLLAGFAPRFDGAVTVETNGRSAAVTHVLSVLGESLSRTRDNGLRWNFSFDQNRRPASVTDSQARGRQLVYNDAQNLEKVVFRDGSEFVYGDFDPRERPRLIQAPGGNITATYDRSGRLKSRTAVFGGRTTEETFTYDALNRIAGATYSDGSAAFTFDKQGPLRNAQYSENGTTFNVAYDLYSTGTRRAVSLPSGVTVTEQRDVSDRLTALLLSNGDPVIRSTTYSASDLVGDRVLGTNVIGVTNVYDLRRRLLARRYTRANSGSGSVLAEVRYAYDAADNRVAQQFIHRSGLTDFFQYDTGDRLIRADMAARPSVPQQASRSIPDFAVPPEVDGGWAAGGFARVFGYDNLDLRTGVTVLNPDQLALPVFATNFATPNAFLHFNDVDGFARGTDVRGNTARAQLWVRLPGVTSPAPVGASLTHDGLGRLVLVERDDGVTIENKYRHDGLRFFRAVSGPTNRCVPSVTGYVYDEARLIEEYDLSSGVRLRARYFYGSDDDEVTAGDIVTAGNTNRYYFLTDDNASVMAVADAAGEVIERVNYDPWGEFTIQAADSVPPRIAQIVSDGFGLLIEFSERVIPVLTPGQPEMELASSAQDLSSLLSVISDGTAVSGTIVYEESRAGFPFGTVVRFIPGTTLGATAEVNVAASQLHDEWNNPNGAQTIRFPFSSPAGTVLHTSIPSGSTAPAIIGRSSIDSPILFHGQYFDYDTGLIYMRARHYDPATGLFLEQDPAGYEDSVNLYAAFSNNPNSFRDPTGMMSLPRIPRVPRVPPVRRPLPGAGPRVRAVAPGTVKPTRRPLPSSVNQKSPVTARTQNDLKNALESPAVLRDARSSRATQPAATVDADTAFSPRTAIHQDAGYFSNIRRMQSDQTVVSQLRSDLRFPDSSCAPASVDMLLRSQGIKIRTDLLAKKIGTTATGSKIGRAFRTFRAHGGKGEHIRPRSLNELADRIGPGQPALAVIRDNSAHAIVIDRITPTMVEFRDPIGGALKVTRGEFAAKWYRDAGAIVTK